MIDKLTLKFTFPIDKIVASLYNNKSFAFICKTYKGNNTMVWDYLILALYAVGMIVIAVCTRNRSKSVNDFLHGGKKGLNGWMTAFAYGTTYFSAVVFIGYAGQFGRSFGLASVWIGIGNALIGSFLAWKVLAKRTKNMTVRLGAKTMPDFFFKRYDSKSLKLVSAIIIFVFLIPYSASVYNGLSNLFEIVFDIDGWIIMLILAALTALYLFFGGYFATALSDFIQGIIMLAGVIVMVVLFLCHPNVNWDLSSIVSDPNLGWFTFSSTNTGFYGNTATLLSLIFLTSFGVWALPQTIHKYYSIRDGKAVKQGMIVSTIFALIIGFGAYFVGSLSSLFPEVASVGNGDVIPVMLGIVIPAGITGVIAVLILSASMSTLSSVSLASASVVAIDIYKGSINVKASDKRVNWTMRILCLVFVAISVLLAILNQYFNFAAIAQLMGISWGTLAGCFIGPYVLGTVWKRVTKSAVWTSIIGSLVLTVVLTIFFGYDKAGWSCTFGQAVKGGVASSPMVGSICMIFSLASTFLVSLFTKKPSDEVVINAFSKKIENEIV